MNKKIISKQATFLVAWVMVLNFGINLILISTSDRFIDFDKSPGYYVGLTVGFGALLTTVGNWVPIFEWALDKRFIMALTFVSGSHEFLQIASGRALTIISLSFLLLLAASFLKNTRRGS